MKFVWSDLEDYERDGKAWPPDAHNADLLVDGKEMASVRRPPVAAVDGYPWYAACDLVEKGHDETFLVIGYFVRRADAIACAEARIARELIA